MREEVIRTTMGEITDVLYSVSMRYLAANRTYLNNLMDVMYLLIDVPWDQWEEVIDEGHTNTFRYRLLPPPDSTDHSVFLEFFGSCEDGNGIGRLRVYMEGETVIDKYAVIDMSCEDMERIESSKRGKK